MEIHKKYVELIWADKYKELRKSKKPPIEKPNLPFQVVESINKPRLKELEGGLFDSSQVYPEDKYPENYSKNWKNKLIWGDNKLVMSSLIKQGWAGKINLIYIDPPFFTGADFSIKTKVGKEEIEKEPSIIEERAYKDTWSGGIASYLKYMYERLVLMRELLAENSSLFVHCDWHVSHYLKCMLDEIFGYENYKNEIIWHYETGGAGKGELSKKHDNIFWYSKAEKYKFYPSRIKIPRTEKALKRAQTPKGARISEDDKMKLPHDVWKIQALNPMEKERVDFDNQKPERLLRKIILGFSDKSDIIADFFCGSGTTGTAAEKLGRRWIMSDLSKFAIQITRKRFLDIHNSYDLEIDKDERKKYGKPARPFELWNIGNYETLYWKEKQDEYLNFMLKLYQSETLKGFRYLHGRKGSRAVHIGPLNAPVTMEEVEKVVFEARANDFDKVDILGWEWSFEVNELAKGLAKDNGINLKLIQIPTVNEIKSSLVGFDLELLKVPEEVVEEELSKYIKFTEVAYLELEKTVKDKKVKIEIKDFQLPPTAELSEIADKINDTKELIDYWAIDWDYKGDTFHNQWQSFRVKKDPKVEYKAKYKYDEEGEYKIMVKVIDVFGNDTNKVLNVKI